MNLQEAGPCSFIEHGIDFANTVKFFIQYIPIGCEIFVGGVLSSVVYDKTLNILLVHIDKYSPCPVQ